MADWAEVVAMAGELPAVEESTSYRTPSLKVAGRASPGCAPRPRAA
jgi:hypothetical protein